MALLDAKSRGRKGLEGVVVGDEAPADNVCLRVKELCILQQQHQLANCAWRGLHLHIR